MIIIIIIIIIIYLLLLYDFIYLEIATFEVNLMIKCFTSLISDSSNISNHYIHSYIFQIIKRLRISHFPQLLHLLFTLINSTLYFEDVKVISEIKSLLFSYTPLLKKGSFIYLFNFGNSNLTFYIIYTYI